MGNAPSILLLDDGELDRVQAILRDLEADFVRLKGREIGRSVTAPLDLLVTSGKRALGEMPKLEPASEDAPKPIWMCLHSQDFLPLRQRLRDQGVHYLVQAALDQHSLGLFLAQLLYRGVERRSRPRLPLGGEVTVCIQGADHRAKLVELSEEVCRIEILEGLELGSSLSVFLPPALSGGEVLELPGTVTHRAEAPGRAGVTAWSLVMRFEGLAPAAAAQLENLATGKQIGTRLTPLAEPPSREKRPSPARPTARPEPAPKPAAAPPPSGPEPELLDLAELEAPERRGEERVSYLQQVQAFTGDGAARLGLGRDLSSDGIRIEGTPGLAEGTRVTLALYGSDRRGEPIMVDARVVRDHGERGLGLKFEGVTPAQRHSIDKLASQLPPLRSLDDDQVRIVSEVTPRDD